MEKIWKAIPSYEGLYEVSNYGEVKSLGNNATRKEKILKTSDNGNGYLILSLNKNSKRKLFQVHQLVAIAFLGHQPNGYETVVNHIDNNPLNNYVGNLELVSQRYNLSCHKKDVGVSFQTNRNKFRTMIRIGYNQVHLGLFTNKQDALNIYQKALDNMHLYNGDNKEFRNTLNKL